MNLNDQSCAKERAPTDFRNYSIFNTEQIENAICHESKLKKCESIFRDKVNEFHCERRNGRESLKNMNHQPSRQLMKTCFDNDAVRPLKAFPRSRGTPKLVFPFTKDPKTPLAGCPKGLLITTERPRSGETYRHRINVHVMRTFDAGISKEKLGNNESSLHKRNIERNQVIYCEKCNEFLSLIAQAESHSYLHDMTNNTLLFLYINYYHH